MRSQLAPFTPGTSLAMRAGNHSTRFIQPVMKSQLRSIPHPMVIHRLQRSRPRVLQSAKFKWLSPQITQRVQVHKKTTLSSPGDTVTVTDRAGGKPGKNRQFEPSGARARSKARDEKHNHRKLWDEDLPTANETTPAPPKTLSLREKVLLERQIVPPGWQSTSKISFNHHGNHTPAVQPVLSAGQIEEMLQLEQQQWQAFFTAARHPPGFVQIKSLYSRWADDTIDALKRDWIRAQLVDYQLWLPVIQTLFAHLQAHPPTRYLTLTQMRLQAARLYPATDNDSSLTDAQCFALATRLLDPEAPDYVARQAAAFTRYEAILCYFVAQVLQLDLDITAADSEQQFLFLHVKRNQIFNPARVIRFYQNQFRTTLRKPAPPLIRRDKLNDLHAYYAQFNHYLAHHAGDDATAMVAQQAVYNGISQLDLECRFASLFAVRPVYSQPESLPQTGARTERFYRGGIIYIAQGDSGKYYAASTWGGVFVIADISQLIAGEDLPAILRLRNDQYILSLDTQSLLTALWPAGADFIPDKDMMLARYDLTMAGETLVDALIKLQRRAIGQMVDALREAYLDESWLEKGLSFIPFLKPIIRSWHDPEYRPSFGELALDCFDLFLTLISLGIPLVKLSVSGIRAGMLALRLGRAAGLTGKLLQQAVLKALQPALRKIAAVTGREIAGFLLPPVDLFLFLKGMRKIQRLKKLSRCIRSPHKACFAALGIMPHLDGREWQDLVLSIYHHPSAWQGVVMSGNYKKSYKQACSALSEEEMNALRRWSWIDTQPDYYLSRQISGRPGLNFKLNDALYSLQPTEEMKTAAKILDQALRKLPVMEEQSLLRVVELPDINLHKFQPGDLVTNAPTFMSASAQGRLANVILARGYLFDAHREGGIVIYHITSSSAKPFLKRYTTQANIESEYLFRPATIFRIEAITRLTPPASSVRTAKTIYFIKLREAETSLFSLGGIKCIRSGESVVNTVLRNIRD
ncbi:hypothetical protein [Pantoea cypripedii]|nr:hypothetical protein [Pantoea cypripedii]